MGISMVDKNTTYLNNNKYRLYTKNDGKNTYFLDSKLENGNLVFKKIKTSKGQEGETILSNYDGKELDNFKVINSFGIIKPKYATPDQIREYYPNYKSQDEIEEEEKKKRDEEAKKKHNEEWKRMKKEDMDKLWEYNEITGVQKNLHKNKISLNDYYMNKFSSITDKDWKEFYDNKIQEQHEITNKNKEENEIR